MKLYIILLTLATIFRLDLHIPMTDRVVVTGYSMCSSPQQFLKSGQLDLAVKRSDDSAASWMHDEV